MNKVREAFEDTRERQIFFFLIGFGCLTLLVNVVKIFTLAPRAQYVLLTGEMILGIGLLFVPFLFTKFTGLIFPRIIRLYYWFFLWIAVFLGTGLRLILLIPFWDKILHFVSPILLVAVGYALIGYYLREVPLDLVKASLFLVMGFAFAGLCGVFWEFWEFLCDSIGNMNLQRYMTESGQAYVGRAALMDTMGDLLINTLGALALTVYSFTRRKEMTYFQGFAFQKKPRSQ